MNSKTGTLPMYAFLYILFQKTKLTDKIGSCDFSYENECKII